jgi:hypothetical protein
MIDAAANTLVTDGRRDQRLRVRANFLAHSNDAHAGAVRGTR